MLFNSLEFILVFLPLTLAGFYLIAFTLRAGTAVSSRGREVILSLWLITSSMIFYAWWSFFYLVILIALLVMNYLLFVLIRMRTGLSPVALVTGIAVNLFVLTYYKYAGFLAQNANELFGTTFHVASFVLPLGISFYTFQKIAFLTDAKRNLVDDHVPLPRFFLFVLFFPQLIAGPIVHYREVKDDFSAWAYRTPGWADIDLGLTLFTIGLAKKVLLADTLAIYATPTFIAADTGASVTFWFAWQGALAYTFQLYFDFSGYSDMAVGLARMFGVTLPINFNSPYKATSIIDFWRRWHITLSRLLRDYLYIPLGGNRYGVGRTRLNLMLTMLIGGLWHGAAWTFVLWGGLHGFYLVINHQWQELRSHRRIPYAISPAVRRAVGWSLTFGAVIVGWVLFRAETLNGAAAILAAMGHPAVPAGVDGFAVSLLAFAILVCLLAPVSHELAASRLGRSRMLRTCILTLSLLAISNQVINSETTPEFLYFNF